MGIQKAGQQVANTYELLEAVMVQLPHQDLPSARAVSKSFSAVITRSAQLQQRMRIVWRLYRATYKLRRSRRHPRNASQTADAWTEIDNMGKYMKKQGMEGFNALWVWCTCVADRALKAEEISAKIKFAQRTAS